MLPNLSLCTVHSDDCLHIQLDTSFGFILVEWLRRPSTQEFRELYRLAAAVAEEHACTYWLSDARPIPFLEFAEQNWLLREMAPHLAASNLAKYARVMTQESLTMMDIQRICISIKEDPRLAGVTTEIQLFLDRDRALAWLFSELRQEEL